MMMVIGTFAGEALDLQDVFCTAQDIWFSELQVTLQPASWQHMMTSGTSAVEEPLDLQETYFKAGFRLPSTTP